MQMATGGRTGGSYPGDHLAHPHRFPFGYGDPLKVVVGGDQAVAVIDFHAVAAAPRVPADSTDHSRVGGVDKRSASRGEVLAPVEFAGQAGNGVYPQPEGRAWDQRYKRGVELPGTRPVKGAGGNVECAHAVLVQGLHRRPFKRHRGVAAGRHRCRGLGGRHGRAACWTFRGKHTGSYLSHGERRIGSQGSIHGPARSGSLEAECEHHHDSQEACRHDSTEFS